METVLNVEGMSCGGCAASVERVLKALPGVTAVAVSLAEARAKVSHDPAQTGSGQLVHAIEAAGFGASTSAR